MGQLPPHFHNKFYSVKQIFIALTLVSMVFLLGKFTSVTVFDTRPERIRLNRWYLKDNQQSRKASENEKTSPLSTSSKQFSYIIENQRLRISREMMSFPFEKDHNLMDFIPDEGGQPVRAMVNKYSKIVFNEFSSREVS